MQESCRLCRGQRVRPHVRLAACAYVRCASCGYIWQSPMPPRHDLAQRYQQSYCEYEVRNADNFRALMGRGVQDIRLAEYAARRLAGRRLLDVGCAIGVMVDEMARAGWQAVGIDICAAALTHGRASYGVNLCRADARDAPFRPATFDAIHAAHVIEHVLQPDHWLRALHDLLRPGGVLILTTPNTASFQARYAGRQWRSYHPDHVQLFNRRNLRRLLQQTGFTVLRQFSWGGIPAGRAAQSVKVVADRLAKQFNLGDVQLFFCRKEE